jgi:hypothetical protein
MKIEETEIVLNLPKEEDIQSTAEIRLPANPGLIRKTIRYKDGLEVILFQDFHEFVFSLSLRFSRTPFQLKSNRILRLHPTTNVKDRKS